MIGRNVLAMLFLLTLANSVIPAAIPTCELKNQSVENFIKKKTNDLKGNEYCQFRLYSAIDDADGDNVEDFIVVFTVEGADGGGNNSVQYLAVWPSSQKSGTNPLSIKVGERGERMIDAIEVRENAIVLTGHEYQKNDAMCCPSKPVESTILLRNGKLVEQTP